jgi:hypothetical protein
VFNGLEDIGYTSGAGEFNGWGCGVPRKSWLEAGNVVVARSYARFSHAPKSKWHPVRKGAFQAIISCRLARASWPVTVRLTPREALPELPYELAFFRPLFGPRA